MAMKQSDDWPELIEYEEDIISKRSLCNIKFINENKSNAQECWICNECDTINNVRDCIVQHGSKCVGCKEKCYIKSQTEIIIRSEWHKTNQFYLLNINELWQCHLCLNINKKSQSHCNKCNEPSSMEIIRCDIRKFTCDQKADRLICGFIKIHQHYCKFNNMPLVLQKVIKQYYVINHNEIISWTLGKITCMSLEKVSSLKVGDKLDYRQEWNRKFVPVKVTNIDQDIKRIALKQINNKKRLKNRRFVCNNYSTFENLNNFAEFKSITSRPASRLKNIKVGDNVDVNPGHRGWKKGKVIKLDDESGQVQVKTMNTMENQDNKFEEALIHWTHVDNEAEIAAYNSMTIHTNKTIYDLLQDEIITQENIRKNLANEWN